ncbi:hypothetical protein DMC30DRAFT_69406 [Rhodotorula diobovata]|uniref:Proteophosphoglycan ppg4 n=1 Tax=Rhodotorula diobovata TaxID=5288 RepID=A0A5C5FMZ9_9BASI|nr:hypothetical protein DMC30DRAFT_69406 [Rhodotorula diobovata]
MARPRTAAALAVLCLVSLSVSALPAARPPSTPTLPPLQAAHLAERQFLCGLFGNCDSSSDSATSAAQTAAGTVGGESAAAGESTSGADDAVPATSTSATDTLTTPVGGASSATSAPVTETSAVPTTSETSPLAETSSTSTSTSSSSSTSSTPTSSSTSSASEVVVTITSVVTNEDGSQSTMTQESASAVPVAPKENSSSGPSGKTWGIVGGVIGGVALLAAALYVGFRLTQRRFSNLDSGGDDIRWPELQPDGPNSLATLNPQGTRRTGGAGFAMEKDRDDDDDEDDDGELDRKGAEGMGGEWSVEGSPRIGAGVGTYGMGHNASEAAFFEGQGRHSPYDGVYGQPLQQGQHDGQTSYYDPYLPHGNASDPALVPLSHAGAAVTTGPYAPAAVSPVYPPTYAHYADAYSGVGRSTEELVQPQQHAGVYRAGSPRGQGY